MRVSILGAGNTGVSLAANLALLGHDVLLWEHPAHEHQLDSLRAARKVHLDGASRSGVAKLAAVTTDAAEALGWSNDLLVSVPSYAHAPFVDALGPHLRDDHLLALLPGNLGTLAWAESCRRMGGERPAPLLIESDTAPYVCRKTAPERCVIWGEVPHLGIGVLPARRTEEAAARLRPYFPGLVAYPNVLVAGLSALNPVVHPAGVLLNAGRIERSRGEFWFYEEGVTPAVVRVIEAVDGERLAVGAALGLVLRPVAEAFHGAGFGPAGDLWATINGSRMLTALRAPGAVDSRWLSEDVPYGLVPWSALGASAGVPTPTIEAVITLASALLGVDFRSMGRGLAELGLERLGADEMAAVLGC